MLCFEHVVAFPPTACIHPSNQIVATEQSCLHEGECIGLEINTKQSIKSVNQPRKRKRKRAKNLQCTIWKSLHLLNKMAATKVSEISVIVFGQSPQTYVLFFSLFSLFRIKIVSFFMNRLDGVFCDPVCCFYFTLCWA